MSKPINEPRMVQQALVSDEDLSFELAALVPTANGGSRTPHPRSSTRPPNCCCPTRSYSPTSSIRPSRRPSPSPN